jgi:molybdopterin synthase catalytic subunit
LATDPIDPWPIVAALRRPSDGGLALFVGVVRDHHEGRAVDRLEYQAYLPMAEKELERIAVELSQAHPAARVAMKHRLGVLEVGDVAVVVAASAPHREEAFAACRDGIESIKARLPVWKREWGPGGSLWVEPCGPGDVETD